MPTQIQSSLKLLHFAKEKTGGAPITALEDQSLTTLEDQCLVSS
jgi:hypothetical protein